MMMADGEDDDCDDNYDDGDDNDDDEEEGGEEDLLQSVILLSDTWKSNTAEFSKIMNDKNAAKWINIMWLRCVTSVF